MTAVGCEELHLLGTIEKGKLWLRKTIQNAGTVLSKDNMNGEAVKTGGKYLCQLIMTAEKVSAELVRTAGKTHSILKQRLAVRNYDRRLLKWCGDNFSEKQSYERK